MSAQQLSVSDAQDLISAWQNLTPSEKGTKIDAYKAWLIPHDAVSELIADNVYAIRNYIGYDETSGEIRLIVVGTTQPINGVFEDIVEPSPNTKIYDFTQACPPGCDPNSPLY